MLRPSLVAVTLVALACGGEKPASDAGTPATSSTPSAQPAGGPQTPDEGRKVITIEMTTDAAGVNKFSPNDFEAHRGDVLRFTLVQGVHNVHFVADSNPGTPMPEASQLLQLPGQTHDIKVSWAAGRYYFQCDPHALLGMIGHVKVEDE